MTKIILLFKRCFFLTLLFTTFYVNGQTLTSTQNNRLFKANQLWGHLTYFHPYLQYKKIPFDSAYAAIIPKILSSQTDADFSNALNEWLGVLNDEITLVEINPKFQIQNENIDVKFQIKDSIGILTMPSIDSNTSMFEKTLKSVAENITTLKGLIVDFRATQGDLNEAIAFSGFQNQLFNTKFSSLDKRSIAHIGYQGESPQSSLSYKRYFKCYFAETFKEELKKEIPIVFFVSPKTNVPNIVWTLQKSGKAIVLSNEHIFDFKNAISYKLTDELKASFRISENINGSPKSDFIVEDNLMMEKANEIFKTPIKKIPLVFSNIENNSISKSGKYPSGKYPSLGYRAIAAAKIYTVIDAFFPNKKLITGNWDSISKKYLSAIVLAKDSAEYNLAISSYYSHINDSHGSIGGTLSFDVIMGGQANSPILGKIIERKYIITAILNDSIAKNINIEKGDIVLKRNGQDVIEIIDKLKQYIAYSNDVSGNRIASNFFSRGANNTTSTFTILKKNGSIVDIKVPFDKNINKNYRQNRNGRRNEKLLKFLTPDIGYVDLDKLEISEVDSMFEMFKNTKAIVFDMRGYPNGTAWEIAPRLTSKDNVTGAKYTRLDVNNPNIGELNSNLVDYETWTSFYQNIPNKDKSKLSYTGKTIMLINENTQSQAEHSALFFKAANGTKLIGSQTAGANGDISNFVIPGELSLFFSGQTVWYPNGTQLQRIGIKPDVFVQPTIKGIQAGKDEVLERAVKYLIKGK